MSGSYEWRVGKVVPVDAEVAGAALEEMAEEHEFLTARIVVDESTPAQAPLHPAFEWDDARAADSWRLEQASYILRSLVVVSVQDDGTKSSERRFLHVPTETVENDVKVVRMGYVPSEQAMADAGMRRHVLETALAEYRSFRRKYQRLTELADLFAAGDVVVETIEAGFYTGGDSNGS